MIYFDEATNITDKDMDAIGKLIDKANRKKHRSIMFWRIIGCRIFGHKASFKKTHMAVAPGLYCGRCFSWIVPDLDDFGVRDRLTKLKEQG